MEEQTVLEPQHMPSFKKLPKFVTTVTPLSKIFAAILFIILPFVGFLLGSNYQKKLFSPQVSSTDSFPIPSSVINLEKSDFPNWHLISRKKYKDFEIGSFGFSEFVSGPEVPIPSLFVIAPILNNQPQVYRDSYAVSMIPDMYFNDSFFDVVGDNIYIVDAQTNNIKVFSAEYSKSTLATPEYYFFEYKKIIPAPNYNIGIIYAIKCNENICILNSAFHQESGCEFELNISTLIYSTPVCHSPGPEGQDYTPEKS